MELQTLKRLLFNVSFEIKFVVPAQSHPGNGRSVPFPLKQVLSFAHPLHGNPHEEVDDLNLDQALQ